MTLEINLIKTLFAQVIMITKMTDLRKHFSKMKEYVDDDETFTVIRRAHGSRAKRSSEAIKGSYAIKMTQNPPNLSARSIMPHRALGFPVD